MPSQQDLPAQQHRAVVRFLEAVIRDAYHMADVTAAFLKAHGYRPRKRSSRSSDAPSEDTPVIRQAKGFLLNLGAALRLARWEHSGLRPDLPSSLPTTAEAFRNLVPPRDDATNSDGSETVPPLSLEVFRTWLECFCHAGQTSIGADILLRREGMSEDDLLDSLADFLWEHRHLASPEERQQ
jgi:hypothetical protein